MNEYVDTFGQALATAADFSTRKSDILAHPDEFSFDPYGIQWSGGQFIRPFDSAALERPAIGHFITLFDVPGLNMTYLADSCPGDLRAANMQHWLEQRRNRREPGVLLRLWDDPEVGMTVRAAASSRFNPELDNWPILSALAAVEANGRRLFGDGMRLARSYVGRDSMNLRIAMGRDVTIPDSSYGDGTYKGGIQIINGETRNSSFRVNPIIWRTQCDNSISVMDWTGAISVRHDRRIPTAEAALLVLELVSDLFLGDGEWNVNALMQNLANAAIDELDAQGVLDQIADITSALSIGEDLAQQFIYHAASYNPTRLGVINAMTRVAQDAPTAVGERMEALAGAYLLEPNLNRAIGRVAKWEREDNE